MTLDERLEALVMTSQLHAASIHELENSNRELRDSILELRQSVATLERSSHSQRDSIAMIASAVDKLYAVATRHEDRLNRVDPEGRVA